jgi:hypothetical protein
VLRGRLPRGDPSVTASGGSKSQKSYDVLAHAGEHRMRQMTGKVVIRGVRFPHPLEPKILTNPFAVT